MIRPFLAQALEPPSPKAVENALELLVTIGAMQGPVMKGLFWCQFIRTQKVCQDRLGTNIGKPQHMHPFSCTGHGGGGGADAAGVAPGEPAGGPENRQDAADGRAVCVHRACADDRGGMRKRSVSAIST